MLSPEPVPCGTLTPLRQSRSRHLAAATFIPLAERPGMILQHPPGGFSSSRLVRLLASFGAGSVAGGGQRLASRVGGWLDISAAISLSAALGVPGAAKVVAAPAAPVSPVEMQKALLRVRTEFADAIVVGSLVRPGKQRIRLPDVAFVAAPDAPASFTPYHRYYLAMQGEMEKSIALLRASARQALATISPAAASLAALDAALETALAERERALLANVPPLLADGFQSLQGDTVDGRFREVLREVLLAELEMRLLPVSGLVGALAQHAAVARDSAGSVVQPMERSQTKHTIANAGAPNKTTSNRKARSNP